MKQATPWTHIYTDDEWHDIKMKKLRRHKWRMHISAAAKRAPRYIFLILSASCISIVLWAGMAVL